MAAERAALDRVAAEQAEQERLVAEQAEGERLAAEQAEQERVAAEENLQRVAAEEAEQERLALEEAEHERVGVEQAEADRVALEQAEADIPATEVAAVSERAAEIESAQVPAESTLERARAGVEQALATGSKKDVRDANEELVDALRPRYETEPEAHLSEFLEALDQLATARWQAGDWWGSRGPSKEAKALRKLHGR